VDSGEAYTSINNKDFKRKKWKVQSKVLLVRP